MMKLTFDSPDQFLINHILWFRNKILTKILTPMAMKVPNCLMTFRSLTTIRWKAKPAAARSAKLLSLLARGQHQSLSQLRLVLPMMHQWRLLR